MASIVVLLDYGGLWEYPWPSTSISSVGASTGSGFFTKDLVDFPRFTMWLSSGPQQIHRAKGCEPCNMLTVLEDLVYNEFKLLDSFMPPKWTNPSVKSNCLFTPAFQPLFFQFGWWCKKRVLCEGFLLSPPIPAMPGPLRCLTIETIVCMAKTACGWEWRKMVHICPGLCRNQGHWHWVGYYPLRFG